MTCWRRNWVGEANLDFVDFDVLLKRELHFRGSEGGRGARHLMCSHNCSRSFLGRFFHLGTIWDVFAPPLPLGRVWCSAVRYPRVPTSFLRQRFDRNRESRVCLDRPAPQRAAHAEAIKQHAKRDLRRREGYEKDTGQPAQRLEPPAHGRQERQPAAEMGLHGAAAEMGPRVRLRDEAPR